MAESEFDIWHIARALELAQRGLGRVEPNPMVGCTIVKDGEIVGEGWHQNFGGPHAEIEALGVAGPLARGATMYVTLEPCSHFGKTPPCTQAIIAAGIRRVVAAMVDPFPQVSGQGLAQLRAAGIEVSTGLGETDARRLNAPYLKLVERGRPWIIAKWAMTLDGKIATISGESQWITGSAARQIVHQIRGRVDAILVGIGTALADDPLLTARPPGERIAARIILDTDARLPSDSQLARTAREAPLLVAVGDSAPVAEVDRLTSLGCEVLRCPGADRAGRLDFLLVELGRRRVTNVLVEGGAAVLGSLLDLGDIDEVHAFVAPILLGGGTAPGPVAGRGIGKIGDRVKLEELRACAVGPDLYLSGRVSRDN